MKKNQKIYSLLVASMFFLFLFASCDELLGLLDETTDEDDSTSKTEQVQNSSGGNVTLGNYEISVIPGTLPAGANSNTDPSTTLSIELDVAAPKPIPSEYTLVSKIVRFGPEGFIFNFPVNIYLPADGISDPSTVGILKFNTATEAWKLVPVTLLKANPNKVGASQIELGVYAVVKLPASMRSASLKSSQLAADSEGGCRSGSFTDNAWISLTVKSVLSLKYPGQASWYNGGLVGMSAMSGTSSTGDSPRNPVHMRLPQGSYQIWVSKLTWDRISGGKWSTYTLPATVNITGPLVLRMWSEDQDYAYDGWITIELPGGGTWAKGRPEDLPATTATVGTGDFQSTLTWVNSSASSTDIDLHLYGPNSLHVYYGNKTPTGAAFNLDVDWRYTSGNAVENIYSISTSWPKGEYRITVLHYGGTVPKSFNARVVRNGRSITKSGNFVSNKEEIEVDKFTIN